MRYSHLGCSMLSVNGGAKYPLSIYITSCLGVVLKGCFSPHVFGRVFARITVVIAYVLIASAVFHLFLWRFLSGSTAISSGQKSLAGSCSPLVA